MRIIRKKTIIINFTLMAFVLLVCGKSATALSAESSDNSFLARISKKNEGIQGISQDHMELNDIYKSKVKKVIMQLEVAAANKSGKSNDNSSSDRKYMDRLENKLNVLIKETLNEVDSAKQMTVTFSPTMIGNLLPESKFDKVDMEKTMDKEQTHLECKKE
ncbi:MAG: hypothetical protein HQL30_06370 [Candidatus Omnitrophica bacterium]|nr:hypothetical protein [Candidatus Omnitrophota bacterium]